MSDRPNVLDQAADIARSIGDNGNAVRFKAAAALHKRGLCPDRDNGRPCSTSARARQYVMQHQVAKTFGDAFGPRWMLHHSAFLAAANRASFAKAAHRKFVEQVAATGGCRYCGTLKRDHFTNWSDPSGWHEWTMPTPEQIQTRMRAGRAKMAATPAKVAVTPSLASYALDASAKITQAEAKVDGFVASLIQGVKRNKERIDLGHAIGRVVFEVVKRYPGPKPPGVIRWGADELEIGAEVMARVVGPALDKAQQKRDVTTDQVCSALGRVQWHQVLELAAGPQVNVRRRALAEQIAAALNEQAK